jgi:hypothetical protein
MGFMYPLHRVQEFNIFTCCISQTTECVSVTFWYCGGVQETCSDEFYFGLYRFSMIRTWSLDRAWWISFNKKAAPHIRGWLKHVSRSHKDV